MKNKRSIKSRLFSLRDKRVKSCRQFVSMECLGRDQPVHGGQLTVPVLRENVRRALIELMRLMRTNSGPYLNLDTDDISCAEIGTTHERNYVFLWAAYCGNVEMAKQLHDEGADINFAHPSANFNALHLAALCGSVECVLWLLRQQCTIVYTATGLSPLHFAAYGKNVRICRYLLEQGCHVDDSVLHAATYADAQDCAAFVLETIAKPNAYDEKGLTALHVATDLGNCAMVDLLLADPRVNVNARTQRHLYTALHLAAENGYLDCMLSLLRHGAQVNEKCTRGQTPLYLSCKQAYVDCVHTLLEHGADVNVQDKEKRTALHVAVSKSPWSLHIVSMLVERDANVNVADEFGYTCLHNAALNELDECVEFLIIRGANVAARTHGNVSALNIINRKTPVSVKTIPRRLDLAMSYKEQNLKLNFRDILRNSHVGEVGYLHALQKEGQSEVLEHPLCQAFLHIKWQKVRAYIILRVILSIMTAILLSFYVLICITNGCTNAIAYLDGKSACIAENDSCVECYNVNSTAISNSESLLALCERCQNKTDDSCGRKLKYANDYEECKNSTFGPEVLAHPDVINWVRCAIFSVLVLNGIRIFFSLAAYRSASEYFTKYLNILELFVTCSVILLEFEYEQDDKFDLHMPVGACAVLCCWTYLMITIGQLPFFGTYIAMFNKVLKEFLKMITAFFCLLVGFTFTFCVLKPTYFGNPIAGFVRIVGMMTGELNLNEVVQIDMSTYLEYTVLGVLWLFMILVTIVLMNLLVGIAVNDVEGLRKTADLCELIQQTKLIYFIELSCFHGYFPKRVMGLLRKFLYIWPDSYTVVLSVRPLNPHEKRIPKDIMDAAVEIAVQRTQARYKANAKTPTVEKRLENLENRLQNIEDTLSNLSKNLMRLTGTEEEGNDTSETIPVESEETN